MSDEAQMVGDSHMRRMDLVALRLRIQNALGQEKWPKYWSVLQRFMRFKLSKEELDNDARAVLGNDNVALHNQLIRGIFQNAIINTVHPPAVETPVAPDPFEPPYRPDKKKKKKTQGVAIPTGVPPAGSNAHACVNTYTHTHIHSLSLSHTHTHSLPLPLSRTQSLTHSLTHSLTQSLTHSPTQPASLFHTETLTFTS